MKLTDPKIIAAMKARLLVSTKIRRITYFAALSKVGGKDVLGFFINVNGESFEIVPPLELLECDMWEIVA